MNEGEVVGRKTLFKNKITIKEGRLCPAQRIYGFGSPEVGLNKIEAHHALI